ncbi:MAG: hypothetical protein ACRETW_10370 [Stenotrophobium sp.]
MKVPISIERSLEVPAPHAKARSLLQDLEGTLRRFPKLRSLKKIGDSSYLWQMNAIGSTIAGISHEVVYAANYVVDSGKSRLSWEPLPKYGNAVIAGSFQLRDSGANTQLIFGVNGELRDVPVPLMYRLLAPPFIQGKFTRLVDIFLEQTRDALLAGTATAPRKHSTR